MLSKCLIASVVLVATLGSAAASSKIVARCYMLSIHSHSVPPTRNRSRGTHFLTQLKRASSADSTLPCGARERSPGSAPAFPSTVHTFTVGRLNAPPMLPAGRGRQHGRLLRSICTDLLRRLDGDQQRAGRDHRGSVDRRSRHSGIRRSGPCPPTMPQPSNCQLSACAARGGCPARAAELRFDASATHLRPRSRTPFAPTDRRDSRVDLAAGK